MFMSMRLWKLFPFFPRPQSPSSPFKFIFFVRICLFSFLTMNLHVGNILTMIKSNIRRASQPLNLMSYFGYHYDLRKSPFFCFSFCGNKSRRFLPSPHPQPPILFHPVNLYNRRRDPQTPSRSDLRPLLSDLSVCFSPFFG